MSRPKNVDVRAPKGEYMISFDTQGHEKSGFIAAVKITIEPAYLGMDESTPINLIDHPLYPHLRQYVLSHLKGTRK